MRGGLGGERWRDGEREREMDQTNQGQKIKEKKQKEQESKDNEKKRQRALRGMLGSVRQIINEISELVYEPQRNAIPAQRGHMMSLTL